MDARAIWQRIETLHAVTYFAPESREAASAAGLRGFWMGYFGFRAAPLGPVSADVVEAVVANFHPAMVRRSVPDVWSFAGPADLLVARAASAAAALRRLAPTIDDVAERCNGILAAVVDAADPLGRPLFAANRTVPVPDDPVARLWQSCTTLREHRGDGHVAALAAHGVDGCEAHVLFAAERGVSDEVLFENRGWSAQDRDDAVERLRERWLLRGEARVLTDDGRRLRAEIEARTDARAGEAYDRALTLDEFDRLLADLTPPAVAVAESGVLPYPNPMGLPELTG